MRYYLDLLEQSKFQFLYSAEIEKPLPCPFCPEGSYCGSWCPLFEVRERDRIPQVDAPDLVRLSVRLHCGAGTRVVEVETGEREE